MPSVSRSATCLDCLKSLSRNDVRSSGSTWILKCCVASERRTSRGSTRTLHGSLRSWPTVAFIFGTDPSAADLSVYHPIWFARQNGGSEVNELISFATVIDPWYASVAAIGHGKSSEMTPDQAIDVAKVNAPSEPHEWSSEATN